MMYIIPKDIADPKTKPDGTGVFKLVEWKTGEYPPSLTPST